MNSERVTPKNAAKELQMDVITLRELMKREKLPIGYAIKREGKSKWGFYIYRHGELPLRDNMWYGTTVTDPDTEYMGQDGHYEFHTFLSVEPILADFGELSEKSYIPEWIIVGAETGSRKDKVIPRREWIENIVEQCRKYNIPVFMKPSLTDIWGEELIQEFPKALIHA